MLTNICLVSYVPLTIQKNAYATIFSNSAQREVFRTGILSHQKRTCWSDSGAVLLLFIFALNICSLFFTFNLFLKIVCFLYSFFPFNCVKTRSSPLFTWGSVYQLPIFLKEPHFSHGTTVYQISTPLKKSDVKIYLYSIEFFIPFSKFT